MAKAIFIGANLFIKIINRYEHTYKEFVDGVRIISEQWRRRESNPRPETLTLQLLRV